MPKKRNIRDTVFEKIGDLAKKDWHTELLEETKIGGGPCNSSPCKSLGLEPPTIGPLYTYFSTYLIPYHTSVTATEVNAQKTIGDWKKLIIAKVKAALEERDAMLEECAQKILSKASKTKIKPEEVGPGLLLRGKNLGLDDNDIKSTSSAFSELLKPFGGTITQAELVAMVKVVDLYKALSKAATTNDTFDAP